ncbi:MAG: hypothetical protein WED08_02035, partial [Patescibacteria group bacterium]
MIRVPLPAREPTWAKVVSHGLTLALVFGTIAVLALGFSDLTHARIRRMFSGFWDQYIERIIPGEVLGINQILDPIIDTNDVLEYKEFNATRWLHSKLPFLFDTGRFLGTVFFGETDNYFISPLGDASFRDLKARSVVANSVGAGSGEFGSIDVETINVGNLTVSSTKLVQNLNVDQLDNFDGSYYLDLDNETGSCSNCLTTVEIDESTLTIAASNADTLDSLDSTQFLRSDTSDNYTSGTLTINAGTILSVAGDLTIADTNISFTGGNTTFDFAAAATRTLTITNSNGANVANLSVEGDVSGNTLTSTVATGTAPLTVASTTLVANLNADLLDGQTGSYYLDWLNFTNKPTIVSSVDGVSNNEGDIDLIAGANITITPNDLANTITFDIDSSGLDADTLDGLDSLQFLRSDTSDNYTSGTLTFDSGTILLIDSGGTLSVDGEFTTADTTLDFTGGNTTIDLAAAALRTLTITNSNGANVANLSV